MAEFIIHNIFFIVFGVVVLGVLMIDLLFVGRDHHTISLKESLLWTAIWVSLAIGFYFFIRFYGQMVHDITDWQSLRDYTARFHPNLILPDNDFNAAMEMYRKVTATDFITGYVLEYTLSIDNIFVILMILTSFSVEPRNYKQVLFWGILGAIILRFIFIFAGSALIHRFEWLLILFGLFLVYSGVQMFLTRKKEEKLEARDHWLVKIGRAHV